MSSDPLFDDTAARFAADMDELALRNVYTRGKLFVEATKKWVSPKGRVLDYGCGPGRLARLIAREGYEVHGVDPSAGMLVEAKKQNLTDLALSFTQISGNGEWLPADSYDAIVCSSVIEYVPDAAALFDNFKRSLHPNGVLILSYANKNSLWRKYSEFKSGHRAPHLRLQHNIWNYRECRTALLARGFEVVAGPIFFDAIGFDKRPLLNLLSYLSFVGTLGLVVAKRYSGR